MLIIHGRSEINQKKKYIIKWSDRLLYIVTFIVFTLFLCALEDCLRWIFDVTYDGINIVCKHLVDRIKDIFRKEKQDD